jgi:hypothetical protein
MTNKYFDEQLENMGLLFSVGNEEKEYIAECIENRDGKFCEIRELVDAFALETERLTAALDTIKNEYLSHSELLIGAVKKYCDTLTTDGIWSNVDKSEAAKKLHTYYAFTKRIGELEKIRLYDFSETVNTEEAFERSLFISERIRLFEISLSMSNCDKNETDSIKEKHFLSAKKTSEVADAYFAVMQTMTSNEKALGEFLAALRAAVDENNKGERMNLTSAKNCCLSFLSKYRKV